MNGPREDQPPAMPAFPTAPDQLPETATVNDLLTVYYRHLMAAVAGRRGDVVPPAELARHALAALACGQAIVDTFDRERWPLVRDALFGGATADDVGVAMGGQYHYERSAWSSGPTGNAALGGSRPTRPMR